MNDHCNINTFVHFYCDRENEHQRIKNSVQILGGKGLLLVIFELRVVPWAQFQFQIELKTTQARLWALAFNNSLFHNFNINDVFFFIVD